MKSNKELACSIIKWIDESNYETYSLSIGHDRYSASSDIAGELLRNWQDTKTWVRVEGGFIIRQVNWPETAASWLAQGKELNKDRPDAIAIISSISSCSFVLKRLADQKNWSATRTFCLFNDAKTLLTCTVDIVVYEGLKCMTKNGTRWMVGNGGLHQIQ